MKIFIQQKVTPHRRLVWTNRTIDVIDGMQANMSAFQLPSNSKVIYLLY
jgi:hypothetical protein